MSNSPTRILKSHEAETETGRISRFNYDDLVERCDLYLNSIREQARQMLVDAHEQAEVLKKQAHEQAYQKGYAEGLAKAEQDVDSRVQTQAKTILDAQMGTLVPASQALAEELQRAHQECLLHWQQSVVEMAVGISEKILHRKLERHPEYSLDTIRKVLQLTIGETAVLIKMHPADLELMEDGLAEVLERLRSTGRVELIPDTAMSRGGCVVTTSQGRIDASIETQLKRIAEELIDLGEPE